MTYNIIKIIKKIIPKYILLKYEAVFRFIFYQFYIGKKFKCNICNKTFRKFLNYKQNEKICPYCGSLSRTRRLYEILSTEFIKDDMQILDFSPSRSIYKKLKKNTKIKYMSSVYLGDFLGDVTYNITNIDCENDKFDLIICYHILEHIKDDILAISELYKKLKKNGTCIIQTPFIEGEIYEDLTIQTDSDRLKHYGQIDHVRIYSVDGLKTRLEQCGFEVSVRKFTALENDKNGFNTEENILVCKK